MRSLIMCLSWFLGLNVLAGVAAAGPISSGGGQGVLCKTHAQETVELLDLWEARVVYGRKIAHPSTSSAQQISAAVKSLKFALANERLDIGTIGGADKQGADAFELLINAQAKTFIPQNPGSSIRHIHGGHLEPTNDAYEVVHPDHCQIVQLVRYTDTNLGGSVLIDQDYVDKMDRTNQAALYLHEAFYAWMRKAGAEPSSLRVRRTMGLAFSGVTFVDPHPMLARSKYMCADSLNEVAVVYDALGGSDNPDDDSHTWSAIITRINGRVRIGFDGVDGQNQGRSKQPFNWNSGTGLIDSSTFGQQVGFDFNTKTTLREDPTGALFADIELTSTPESTMAYTATLPCSPVSPSTH